MYIVNMSKRKSRQKLNEELRLFRERERDVGGRREKKEIRCKKI